MKEAFVIGIAGGTGSGKTTLARRLKEGFHEDVILLCQDYYYKSNDNLPFDERVKLNYDHPNSFDTTLMIEQIKNLKQFHSVDRPVYSFVEHRRLAETLKEKPRKVIIIEGILLFENVELIELMDIKIFVDTAADLRFIRRLERDTKERGRSIDSVVSQYLTTVRPMHEAFVEPSKKRADIIVPEGGMNDAAFSMIVEKINSIVNGTEKILRNT